MKQRFTINTLILLAVLAAGCSDELGPTAAMDEAVVEGTAADQSGVTGPSASGHMNFYIEGGLQTFSFHARQQNDGTVAGNFQVKSRGQDITVHGDIDCMTVEGNKAYLNGTVTKADEDNLFGLEEGVHVLFNVEDHGEGQGAEDAWTDIIPFDTYAFCYPQPFPLIPNEGGNIQVKP